MDIREDLFKCLDKVLEKQHRIVNSIVNMAEREIKRERIESIEEGLLIKEFEALAEEYRNLRGHIGSYKEMLYGEKSAFSGMSYSNLALTQEEAKTARKDDITIVNVREELLGYIREAYTDMEFITDIDVDAYSMYDGKREEAIRTMEYESYTQNLHVLEQKDLFDDIDVYELPFWAKASVIEEEVNSTSYEKAYKAMCRVVQSLDNKGKYEKLTDAEREELRRRAIYKKYEELYLFLNQKYNGLLTSEMRITGYVEVAKKARGLNVFLGITKDELDNLFYPKVKEYVESRKDDMTDDLRDVTKARRERKKVKPRKLSKTEITESLLAKVVKQNGRKKNRKQDSEKQLDEK